MTSLNRLLKPPAFLVVAMALAAAPTAAEAYPGGIPGPASGPATGDTLSLAREHRDGRTPVLTPPRSEPAFGGLIVLVLPWTADRHHIETRRRLQFALRLDEPKEPAFRVTLRF